MNIFLRSDVAKYIFLENFEEMVAWSSYMMFIFKPYLGLHSCNDWKWTSWTLLMGLCNIIFVLLKLTTYEITSLRLCIMEITKIHSLSFCVQTCQRTWAQLTVMSWKQHKYAALWRHNTYVVTMADKRDCCQAENNWASLWEMKSNCLLAGSLRHRRASWKRE